MAKKWYPVIDILTCQECGSCVAKCTHGVYDKSKAPVPMVVNPDNCIDHCHGCGNLCPIGAIAYVGDDTGWIAPALQNQPQAKEECCCCGSTSKGKKEIKIEYLYLDLKTCDRCVGTDAVLDEVVEALRPALELAGYQLSYRKQEVYTVEIAASYRFLSSPTILVNGQDIFDTITESDCAAAAGHNAAQSGSVSGPDRRSSRPGWNAEPGCSAQGCPGRNHTCHLHSHSYTASFRNHRNGSSRQ